MPAPMRRERQRLLAGRSARSGRWPSRVWMTWKPLPRIAAEHALDRLDRRARQRQIIAHLVDIAADAAEIGLHVDDDQRGVLRPQVAVIGPRIGIGGDIALGHVPPLASRRHRVIDSSAGAPTSVRFGEQVTIMISERQDIGRGVEQVIARGDADRLQRGPERAGAAEQQRRPEAQHRVPAREDHQRHRGDALAARQALVPAARDSRATGTSRRCRRESRRPWSRRSRTAIAPNSPSRARHRRSRRRCAGPGPSASCATPRPGSAPAPRRPGTAH